MPKLLVQRALAVEHDRVEPIPRVEAVVQPNAALLVSLVERVPEVQGEVGRVHALEDVAEAGGDIVDFSDEADHIERDVGGVGEQDGG